MPIDLIAGETRELNVAMTPIAGPGDLALRTFTVFTIYSGGRCYWDMQCTVDNHGTAQASGSIHVTGDLLRAKGAFPTPIDKTFNVTIPAGRSHEISISWREYLDCEQNDNCWFQLNTSWGETTRKMWWQAGFNSRPNIWLVASDITADSAVLRYSGGGGDRFRFTLWSPPSWPDHVIDEEIKTIDGFIYYTAYFYAMRLKSKRQYKAWADASAMDDAETLFNTP